MRRTWPASAAIIAGLLLSGCTGSAETPATTTTPTTLPPSPSATPIEQVQPAGTPTVPASGLRAPWSVVRLPDGSALISERDTAIIKELTDSGELRDAGTIAGVTPGGEGGLLGIEMRDAEDGLWLYAYFTAASDNRIVRMQIEGETGALELVGASVVVSGIAKARNHNGGRIKFGPDGMLYATVGDAGNPALAQDPTSLNGKILRMAPDGSVPDDNPTPGSLVYTLGHRNPQGLAWDSTGQLWASEFGQNTWDELNIIKAGNNYGWPTVEGAGGVAGFTDPAHQWSTAEASPSGLAIINDTLFMATLRGQTLWAIYPTDGRADAVSWYRTEYGRLRDAIPGPDGSLWVLTNNTDGRGNPAQDDDKLMQIRLTPLTEG
ncbi:glucose/arabinose dehydrogenase [Homoserinimonas aerilata]|uniref:Glucose/arabinose dehydrogenase n=2 Tax=Homoserinimonas aerilata TaxID=1162970 RepID=A0A542Y1H5_9MICO|nr:glucose/arabinose dehydrogenase [Homoserinimonas aerilata]